MGDKVEISEAHCLLTAFELFFIYFSYVRVIFFAKIQILMLLAGYLAEFLEKASIALGISESFFTCATGYAPLFKTSQYFWLRRFYQRVRDLFERPITSIPADRVRLMDRKSHDGNSSYEFTGKILNCLNLGSYNYLGFAENSGPVVSEVLKSIGIYSYSTSSTSAEAQYKINSELEEKIASFVGKPDAIVFGMGFATNSTSIPLLGPSKVSPSFYQYLGNTNH
jgi:serine palmitoyltransferase